MRKIIIMGAGGRDFHNFNVVFRDDPETPRSSRSPRRRSRASTTAATRRRSPGRATRTASRSGPRTSSPTLIRERAGRRGRPRLLRPLARGR